MISSRPHSQEVVVLGPKPMLLTTELWFLLQHCQLLVHLHCDATWQGWENSAQILVWNRDPWGREMASWDAPGLEGSGAGIRMFLGSVLSMLVACQVFCSWCCSGDGSEKSKPETASWFHNSWSFCGMWVMQHFPGGNPKGSVIFLCLTRPGPGLPFQLCSSPAFLLALGSASGYAYTPCLVTVLDPAVCSSSGTVPSSLHIGTSWHLGFP